MWLAVGAADATLRALSNYLDHKNVARGACRTLAALAGSTLSHGAGVLVDGSALMPLLKCLSEHTTDAEQVQHALSAIGSIVAALQPSAHIDAAGIIKMLVPLAQAAVEDADSDEAADNLAANQAYALGMLALHAQRQGGVAGAAPLPSLLPSIDPLAPLDAHVMWESWHSDEARFLVAVRAATASSTVMSEHSTALEQAARRGSVPAADVVLGRVGDETPSFADQALRLAVVYGHKSLVRHLLEVWRANPASEDHSPVWIAAGSGDVAVLELLMQYITEPIRDDRGTRLWLAASRGHLPMVEQLLSDDSVDPSAFHNAAIRMACRGGHLSVVQRLLADERTDPHAGGQAALEAAAAGGHLRVLEALLADPRVDAVGFMEAEFGESWDDDDDNDSALRGAELPWSSQFVLSRQPSVARELVTPPGLAYGARIQHSYKAADVRAWYAAAWRRRRHAVLAWMITDTDV